MIQAKILIAFSLLFSTCISSQSLAHISEGPNPILVHIENLERSLEQLDRQAGTGAKRVDFFREALNIYRNCD